VNEKRKEVAISTLMGNGSKPVIQTVLMGGFWTPMGMKEDDVVCHLVLKRGKGWEVTSARKCDIPKNHLVVVVGDLDEPPPQNPL
jgi:hypothetical protein